MLNLKAGSKPTMEPFLREEISPTGFIEAWHGCNVFCCTLYGLECADIAVLLDAVGAIAIAVL